MLNFKSYVYYFFIFDEQKLLKNCEKYLLFHQRSSFCYQNIQVLKLSSSGLPWSFYHVRRRWLKINFEIPGIQFCLNLNLETYFWISRKVIKSFCIKTWTTNIILHLKFFLIEKLCRKCALESSSNLSLVNSPKQPTQVRNSFVDKMFCKRIIKNPQNIIWFLSFFFIEPSAFKLALLRKTREFGTCYQSPSMFPNVLNILCSAVLNNFHQTVICDHLYMPKILLTWPTWANTKKRVSGIIPFN